MLTDNCEIREVLDEVTLAQQSKDIDVSADGTDNRHA
jgi:hypothetical protein